MKYAAAIIETREVEDFRQIIIDHTEKIPQDWQLYIFYSNQNVKHVLQETERIREKKLINMSSKYGRDITSIEDYNRLLTSEEFWDEFNADFVLIFQTDSMILTDDRNAIMQYTEYDYVGAPWKFYPYRGNGGLSLRNVWAMKSIIRDVPYTPSHGNEDVYFCNIMEQNKMNLAPIEVCKTFSVESIFELGTWGCHAIEKYHSLEECNEILTQYCNEDDTSNTILQGQE